MVQQPVAVIPIGHRQMIDGGASSTRGGESARWLHVPVSGGGGTTLARTNIHARQGGPAKAQFDTQIEWCCSGASVTSNARKRCHDMQCSDPGPQLSRCRPSIHTPLQLAAIFVDWMVLDEEGGIPHGMSGWA